MNARDFVFYSTLVLLSACAEASMPKKYRLAEPLMTVTEYGPWIVTLRHTHSHNDFNRHFVEHLTSIAADPIAAGNSTLFVPRLTHRFDQVLHGVVVHGVLAKDLAAFPSVLRVVEDGVRELMDDLSWGQDRIGMQPSVDDKTRQLTFYPSTIFRPVRLAAK